MRTKLMFSLKQGKIKNMGIEGFSNFLKKYCSKKAIQKVPVEKFNGSVIAVDIAITISVVAYVAKNETTKRKAFPEPEKDIEYYHNRAPKILWRELTKFVSSQGPEYIFIFDGKSPALKKKNAGQDRYEAVKKNQKRFKEAYMVFEKKKQSGFRIDDDLKKDLRNGWIQSTPIPPGIYNIAKDMIKALGMKYYQSQTEAEKDCAKLAKLGIVDGVFTTDSDALTFGAPYIIRKRLSETNDFGLPYDCFEVVYLNEILESINFTYKEYVDLCIAMRCDYNIRDVKAAGRFGMVGAYKMIDKYRRLHRVPEQVKDTTPFHYKECRDIFCSPGTLEYLKREDFKINYKHFLRKGMEFIKSMGWVTNLANIEAIYLEKELDCESMEDLTESGEVVFESSSEEEINPTGPRPKVVVVTD